MAFFRKGAGRDPLAVTMTGVEMGNRVLQIGSSDRRLTASLATKVGLSGHACLVALDASDRARGARAAAKAGALVDVIDAAGGSFEASASDFDVAVIDDTASRFTALPPEERAACLQSVWRSLRPAGRVIVVERAARGGLRALVSRRDAGEAQLQTGLTTPALVAEGFKPVRVVGEREGLRFVEGLKPRGPG